MAKPRKNSAAAAAAAAANSNASAAADAGADVRAKPKKRTRKSVPRESPSQRSSVHRGVTRHRWTGRFEAHLWDKNSWNESQNKKGKQVYLGAYDEEEAAARAYDLAALKYWGPDTILNFPLSIYEEELKEMEGQSREEYIGSLRRKSSGFSRGVSKYRGVARHHHNGRWEARIGRVFGNKYLYLGTYATQEEAAMAYDMAAIEYRGLNAVTNFDLSRYIKWLRPGAADVAAGAGRSAHPMLAGLAAQELPAIDLDAMAFQHDLHQQGMVPAAAGQGVHARPHAHHVRAQPAAAVAQVQGDDRADVGRREQHHHVLLVHVHAPAAAGHQGRRRLAAVQLPGGHPDLLRQRRRRGLHRRRRPLLRGPVRLRVAAVPVRAGLV
uniref:AP2/ERF domain-containing protein n=1 Tax=Aegilops tauschii subsp. strangulata TaxID=200361 RepID=A0A453KWD4_AEGTS